jgi:hypothetical protein
MSFKKDYHSYRCFSRESHYSRCNESRFLVLTRNQNGGAKRRKYRKGEAAATYSGMPLLVISQTTKKAIGHLSDYLEDGKTDHLMTIIHVNMQ